MCFFQRKLYINYFKEIVLTFLHLLYSLILPIPFILSCFLSCSVADLYILHLILCLHYIQKVYLMRSMIINIHPVATEALIFMVVVLLYRFTQQLELLQQGEQVMHRHSGHPLLQVLCRQVLVSEISCSGNHYLLCSTLLADAPRETKKDEGLAIQQCRPLLGVRSYKN